MNMESQNIENKPNLFSSKEGFIAKQFIRKLKKMSEDELHDDNIIKERLVESDLIKDQSISPIEVIKILRAMGEIPPTPLPEKKEKPKIEPEFIPITIEKKEMHIVHDEDLERNFNKNQEAVKLKEEKSAIFAEGADIDDLYQESLKLEKNREVEKPEYYDDFTKVGYSKEEIEKDLIALKEREEEFKKNESPEIQKSKKIATMAEIAIDYAVSELGWYGENIKIEPTSKFDDIKRRVDGLLKIQKGNEESQFMGLGIDVTFRGIYSKQYKEKAFVLFKSIYDGYKTKIKYHKDSNGEPKKEFAVPKVILSLNSPDIKNLVYMLKNINDPKIREDFKNHNMKYDLMNQMLVFCKKLSVLAKEFGNTISEDYEGFYNTIKEIAGENEVLKTVIAVGHSDNISMRLDELIKEFKEEVIAKKKAA